MVTNIDILFPGPSVNQFRPSNYSSLGPIRRGCNDWPEAMSLQVLKALLKGGPFANIGIDCNVSHSQKVCTCFFIYSYLALVQC